VRTASFTFVLVEPGARDHRFKRKTQPNYFKEGKPYFDEVEFISITTSRRESMR